MIGSPLPLFFVRCYPAAPMVWILVIAALVFGLALLMKHFAAQVVEDEHAFLMVVGGFLAAYALAAGGIIAILPDTKTAPEGGYGSFISFAPAETVKDQLVRLGEIPVFRLPLALLR